MGLYDTLESWILIGGSDVERNSVGMTAYVLLYGTLAVASALSLLYCAYQGCKEDMDLRQRGMVRVVVTIERIPLESRVDEGEQLELKF